MVMSLDSESRRKAINLTSVVLGYRKMEFFLTLLLMKSLINGLPLSTFQQKNERNLQNRKIKNEVIMTIKMLRLQIKLLKLLRLLLKKNKLCWLINEFS